jgi:hypothetical protein
VQDRLEEVVFWVRIRCMRARPARGMVIFLTIRNMKVRPAGGSGGFVKDS